MVAPAKLPLILQYMLVESFQVLTMSHAGFLWVIFIEVGWLNYACLSVYDNYSGNYDDQTDRRDASNRITNHLRY